MRVRGVWCVVSGVCDVRVRGGEWCMWCDERARGVMCVCVVCVV